MTTVTDGRRVARCARLRQGREQGRAAARLLRQYFFDPDKELDWDAPFEEGKWFWPPELVSLYGTAVEADGRGAAGSALAPRGGRAWLRWGSGSRSF